MQKFLITCLDSRIEEDGVMYGRFLFGAFPRGVAVTIASALRRSLLANVAGFAITQVEFVGAKHEYSTLPGTQESVLDVLLNLKRLVFTASPDRHLAIGYCSGRGPGVITARDLKLPPGVQCTTPDRVIAHLAHDGLLHFSFLMVSGKNYVMQTGPPHRLNVRESRKNVLKKSKAFGFLQSSARSESPEYAKVHPFKRKATTVFSINAVFMPVLRVNYMIHSDDDVLQFSLSDTSLQVTERVVFEIWTNGNVTPRAAIHQASSHLIGLFSQFQIPDRANLYDNAILYEKRKRTLKSALKAQPTRLQWLQSAVKAHPNWPHTLQTTMPGPFLLIDIAALPLSPTIYAELKRRQIERLGHFINLEYKDLANIPGMTSEVIFEVLSMLRVYGIRLLPKHPTFPWFQYFPLDEVLAEMKKSERPAPFFNPFQAL